MDDVVEKMEREWDERAERGAMRYLKTFSGGETDDIGSLDEFLESGETVVRRLVDPVLDDWDRTSNGWAPHGATALDIGCGVGRTTRALSRRFDHTIGVDVSREMVEQARRSHEEFDSVEFYANSGVDFGELESDSIDYAFSYEVFPHVPEVSVIERNVSELSRVLAPDGLCQLQIRLPHSGWLYLFGTVPFPKRLMDSVPPVVKRAYHALAGNEEKLQKNRDPLKNTDTYDGVTLSLSEGQDVFTANGFDRVYFWPDPTYPPDSRAFCLVTNPE